MTETKQELSVREKSVSNETERVSNISSVERYQDWLHRVYETTESEIERRYKIARAMAALDIGRERARKKSMTDGLTRLYNRGAFDKFYETATKKNEPFGLLLFDIDFFKKVNDTYGHQAGDSVLFQVGMEITNTTRQLREGSDQNDIVARYGGEEIVVLLPNVKNENNLREISEKIRRSIGNYPFRTEDRKIPVTVSVGGGIFRNGNSGEFFKTVDNALYEAKDQGRNRTVISGTKLHLI